MALQHYSGDPRHPAAAAAAPSYFTAAAIRAGYAVAAAPPPSVAHRDALHREYHDERVREEYFAREIARNRLLLDQQLRLPPAPIYIPRTEFVAASAPPQRVERLPYFLEAGVGGSPVERRAGYARTPAALRPKAVIRKQRPLVKRAAGSRDESTLPQKLSGIKRKAATTEAVNDPPQQDKKWSCSLCQVFTTSEQNLKSHLQGQKHKAVQESGSSQSKVADKSLPADGLKVVDKQLSTDITKEPFFCDVCKLKCNSQFMLNSHLNGKKHREGLLNSQSKVPDKTVEPGLMSKKQKAMQESHGSQSKVADKVLPVVDESKQVNKLLSTNLVPEEQKQSNPVPKEQKFSCKDCNVKCTSQSDLNSHLKGKRHNDSLFFCEVCKVTCFSSSNLNSHLNGKRHKESLTGNVTSAGTSKEVNEPTSLVAVKETKPGVQQKQVKSKRKSLTDPKSNLNGKKHKAQLEELNKVQDDKPATAEQSGKDSSPVSVEESGKKNKPVNAAETKLASEKPAIAEQSGNDKENKSVKIEVPGEDGSLVA